MGKEEHSQDSHDGRGVSIAESVGFYVYAKFIPARGTFY